MMDTTALALAERHIACDRLKQCSTLLGHGPKCSVTRLARDISAYAEAPIKLNDLNSKVDFWVGQFLQGIGRGDVRTPVASCILSTAAETQSRVEAAQKKPKRGKRKRR